MRDHEPTIRSRELGLALKRAARAKGLHGAEVARRLGWSGSRISRLYSGQRGCENLHAAIAITSSKSGSRRERVVSRSLCSSEPVPA